MYEVIDMHMHQKKIEGQRAMKQYREQRKHKLFRGESK